MKLSELDEFSSILSEGFLVDRLLREKDSSLAKSFIVDIQIGREMVKSSQIYYSNPILRLRRYNWFMDHRHV